MAGIFVGQCAVGMPQLVSPPGTGRDLDALRCLVDQVSETSVEAVEIPDLLELRAGDELIRGHRIAEGMPVGRKPVVIEMRQAVLREGVIGDREALGTEEVHLLRVGFRRFRERWGWRREEALAPAANFLEQIRPDHDHTP